MVDLPAPVWPEEAEHFALIHVQVHVEHAAPEAVILCEIVYFNYVHFYLLVLVFFTCFPAVINYFCQKKPYLKNTMKFLSRAVFVVLLSCYCFSVVTPAAVTRYSVTPVTVSPSICSAVGRSNFT